MDRSSSKERIELFALVAYIPEPLAGFVDAVRDELAPGCRLRAHITILPPRQFACGEEVASREIQKVVSQARSFRVSVGGIKVFPISEVVHVAIEGGLEELRELHDQFNQGDCKAPELWRFEPHLTLAQDLEPAAVRPAFDLAARRWREYSGPRSFAVEHLTFVRRALESRAPENEEGAAQDCWVDLRTWELRSAVLA
jgi:2'-5' RNA ligase